jgi:hypothetical protein
MGHPLGATGARQISTLFAELKRTGGKIGVTSMCIGSGSELTLSVWRLREVANGFSVQWALLPSGRGSN